MDPKTPDQFVADLEALGNEEVQTQFFDLFQKALAIEENETTTSQEPSNTADTK